MIRQAFLDVSASVVEAASAEPVAGHWDAPSALDRMTIGTLVAHAVGAIINVEMCLASDSTDGGVEPTDATDAADYYVRVTAMGDYHGGLDSELQAQVRDGSAQFAALGAQVVAQTGRECLARLNDRFAKPIDDRVAVFGGLRMGFGDYLETRIAELAIHLDDLTASPAMVGVAIGSPNAEAWEITARVMVELALRQHGTAAVSRALTRLERATSIVVL